MTDQIAAHAPLAVREIGRGVRELLHLPLDEAVGARKRSAAPRA